MVSVNLFCIYSLLCNVPQEQTGAETEDIQEQEEAMAEEYPQQSEEESADPEQQEVMTEDNVQQPEQQAASTDNQETGSEVPEEAEVVNKVFMWLSNKKFSNSKDGRLHHM